MLFYKFYKNILTIFSGRNIIWHLIAIGITFLAVSSGFDWKYYTHTRGQLLQNIIFPAIIAGGILPIILPLSLFIIGKIRKNFQITTIAWALGQSALLGWLVSSIYKFFTGRAGPPHFFITTTQFLKDTSHVFKFGLYRGGIFWGWPSSHTTIAFAMAVTLFVLFSNSKHRKYIFLLYALYVGIGVSVSIHWFSDFLAGAIIGSIVGAVIGNSFKKTLK